MPTTLVSPMNETPKAAGIAAPRISSLKGKSIALLDISKPGGGIFFDRLEALLKEQYGVASVTREMKPTFTKPAPQRTIEKVRRADAVIEGLAD
jgi:hypothetical protein